MTTMMLSDCDTAVHPINNMTLYEVLKTKYVLILWKRRHKARTIKQEGTK